MGKPTGAFLDMWRHVFAYVEDRKRRAAASRELAAMDPQECASVLREVGLQRSDLRAAMRTPFVSEALLSSAMRSMGVDPAAFRLRHGAWSRDMDRVCMACNARSRCRRDLATSDFVRRYRHYCPNAASLAEIAANAAKPGLPNDDRRPASLA